MDDDRGAGTTIRGLRQARGWTQFELALRVGVQPQAVYLWDSGRRTPQVPQLRRLGALFEICSDEIDLEPPPGPIPERAAHRPRAGRQSGESVPGRNASGRASLRAAATPAADWDDP